MQERIRVLIASGEPNWAGALAALLTANLFEVTDVVTSTNWYLASIGVSLPDVAVISLGLEGIVEAVGATSNDAAILCIGADSPEPMLEVLEVGAMGYLEFDAGFDEIVDAVGLLAGGHGVVPPAMLGTLLRRTVRRQRARREALASLAELTDREREVFGLVALGLNKDDIAVRLFISPQTARTHIQRLFRKIEVHSRAEAVAFAARCGMALSESED